MKITKEIFEKLKKLFASKLSTLSATKNDQIKVRIIDCGLGSETLGGRYVTVTDDASLQCKKERAMFGNSGHWV